MVRHARTPVSVRPRREPSRRRSTPRARRRFAVEDGRIRRGGGRPRTAAARARRPPPAPAARRPPSAVRAHAGPRRPCPRLPSGPAPPPSGASPFAVRAAAIRCRCRPLSVPPCRPYRPPSVVGAACRLPPAACRPPPAVRARAPAVRGVAREGEAPGARSGAVRPAAARPCRAVPGGGAPCGQHRRRPGSTARRGSPRLDGEGTGTGRPPCRGCLRQGRPRGAGRGPRPAGRGAEAAVLGLRVPCADGGRRSRGRPRSFAESPAPLNAPRPAPRT